MTCDSCVKDVSDSLYKLGGITKVEANLEDQLLSVEGTGTSSSAANSESFFFPFLFFTFPFSLLLLLLIYLVNQVPNPSTSPLPCLTPIRVLLCVRLPHDALRLLKLAGLTAPSC